MHEDLVKLRRYIVAGKFNTSARMLAILGCLLGEAVTTPAITGLCVTSDGCLMGRQSGHLGYNDFIGSRDDLINNLHGIATVFEFSTTGREALVTLVPQQGEFGTPSGENLLALLRGPHNAEELVEA